MSVVEEVSRDERRMRWKADEMEGGREGRRMRWKEEEMEGG